MKLVVKGYERFTLQDTKTKRLEEQLNSVMVAIIRVVENELEAEKKNANVVGRKKSGK